MTMIQKNGIKNGFEMETAVMLYVNYMVSPIVISKPTGRRAKVFFGITPYQYQYQIIEPTVVSQNSTFTFLFYVYNVL